MIASGTIEERMLELQAHKRNLATALFDPNKAYTLHFTEQDLTILFQPIA